MKEVKQDKDRERRIQEEAIVDAYGPEEQALGWYYYLDDKITFPFSAHCIEARRISPLKKGKRFRSSKWLLKTTVCTKCL